MDRFIARKTSGIFGIVFGLRPIRPYVPGWSSSWLPKRTNSAWISAALKMWELP